MVANLKPPTMSDNITMSKNQLIIQSFKPKAVGMFSREDLQKFQDQAEATGVGLEWPQWRTTLELGSVLWKESVKEGAIPAELESHIRKFVAEKKQKKVMPHKSLEKLKKEKEKDFLLADKNVAMQQLADFAAKHGLAIAVGPAEGGAIYHTSQTGVLIPDDPPALSASSSSSSSASTVKVTVSSSSARVSPVGESKSREFPKSFHGPRLDLELDSPPLSPKNLSDVFDNDVSDGHFSSQTLISEQMMRVLKMNNEEVRKMSVEENVVYFDVRESCVESEETFRKRVVFWEWMVGCLKREKENGPLSYLADGVNIHKYDVAGLYTSILNAVDIQNPFLFWRVFTDFVNVKPHLGEDIFSYFTRLQKMCAKLSIREPSDVGLGDVSLVSDLCLRIKMLDATDTYPEYKTFAAKLKTQKPSKWINMTAPQIIEALKIIHDGTVAMSGSVGRGKNIIANEAKTSGRGRAHSRESRGSRARSRSTRPKDCPDGVCWHFWQDGACPYDGKDGKKCSYKHERASSSSSSSSSTSRATSDKKNTCGRCGGNHSPSNCSWKGKCNFCGIEGHKEALCRKKGKEEKKEGEKGEKREKVPPKKPSFNRSPTRRSKREGRLAVTMQDDSAGVRVGAEESS